MSQQENSPRRVRVSAVGLSGFDVFLSYNSSDKVAVREIAERLVQNGITVFLDRWEVRPGVPWQRSLEEQIRTARSAAVFIGKSGISSWQRAELAAFSRRGCTVIPVFLPSATQELSDLPLSLQEPMSVDFREDDPDDPSLDQLIWGITGRRPKRGHLQRKRLKGQRLSGTTANGKAK